MSDIIATILKSSPNKKEMKAPDFYTDNNPNGYCSKQGFKALLSQIGENNLQKAELIIEYLSEGYSNDNPAVTYDDEETGLKMMWTKFDLGSSLQRMPFFVTERMAAFMKDCQKRKIKPGFTFEELYLEAVKEDTV
jgi:hypothetical protein